MRALRPCLVVYWLSLALWLAALVAGGIAAILVFSRLPATPMRLEAFEAYRVDEHGRIAAGLVMADIFFTTDVIQFVAVPLALGMLVLQVTVFGLPLKRPSNLVRLGCVGVGAGLFAVYALAVAPEIYENLRGFWEAARAGDPDSAAHHAEVVRAYHGTAELVLQTNLVLVLVALGASALALGPTPRRNGGLEPPELLRGR